MTLPDTSTRDNQLMQRIEQRQQEALLTLFECYGAFVKGMAYAVLQDDGLAEEITQDVFLKVWRQPQRWDPDKGRLSTWLLNVTRNAAIDRQRKEQRRPTGDAAPLIAVDDLPQPAPTTEMAWYDGQVMRDLLRELPDEQQTAIYYAFYQGMTHEEVAEHLELPLGTAKSRLRRGLQRLKALWLDVRDSM